MHHYRIVRVGQSAWRVKCVECDDHQPVVLYSAHQVVAYIECGHAVNPVEMAREQRAASVA